MGQVKTIVHLLHLAIGTADSGLADLLRLYGIDADVREIRNKQALDAALNQPEHWDLLVCAWVAYAEFGLEAKLAQLGTSMPASVIIVAPIAGHPLPATAWRHGASDVVVAGDLDHLAMVVQRELANTALRKAHAQLARTGDQASPMVIATINNIVPRGRGSRQAKPGDKPPPAAPMRVKTLMDAGGLMLQFQPIVPLYSARQPCHMFEVLVRLKDETGDYLLPDDFLPVVAASGWMPKLDLWILRKALTTLRDMRRAGAHGSRLFVNLASITLADALTMKTIVQTIERAPIQPGSIVIEIASGAFASHRRAISELRESLRACQHALLLDNANIQDCASLHDWHRDLDYLKLSQKALRDFPHGRLSEQELDDLVARAHELNIQVVALGIDNVDALPRLLTIGVDAVQSHLIGRPYEELIYPVVKRLDRQAALPKRGMPGHDNRHAIP